LFKIIRQFLPREFGNQQRSEKLLKNLSVARGTTGFEEASLKNGLENDLEKCLKNPLKSINDSQTFQ
jgi:hypothetical protein